MPRPRKRILYILLTLVGGCLLGLIGVYCYARSYGLNVLLRRGASIWLPIAKDDRRISPAMRLALREPPPAAAPGILQWRLVDVGFEVAELPVMADGIVVDEVLLARVDPALYRFQVYNAPAGNREPADWLDDLGAVLVINGSYFARDGTPETPLVSQGKFLGPNQYDARHGAFIASAASAGIVDLAQQDWRQAFQGATDAMVSYPLLIGSDGKSRASGDRRWLANRSFVGVDDTGRIVLGTTKGAFFSLDRFAEFLQQSPLRLTLALNLDGGPVACQGIRIGDFIRDFCGSWETAVHDGQLKLLAPLVGKRRWGLPIVLAVSRK